MSTEQESSSIGRSSGQWNLRHQEEGGAEAGATRQARVLQVKWDLRKTPTAGWY